MSLRSRETPKEPRERAWVEVNPSALRANLETVRRAVGDAVEVIPMVKADGYGLGVEGVVGAFEAVAPHGYGVATVEEGRQLRRLGIGRTVTVFSPIPPGARGDAVAEGLTLSVSTLDEVEALAALAGSESVAVQVEVDTGMGRAGFPAESAGEWWPAIRDAPGLEVAGVWTHLHSADEDDLTSAHRQVERFRAALGSLEGLDEGTLVHVANSAGSLRLRLPFATAVRPGIFLYGGSVGAGAPTPREVVRVVGRVGLVRTMPPGSTLGYGATHTAEATERWATVMIGYGDGLPRILGNRGRGLVGGQAVRIIGRISMDVTVVDITGAGTVNAGDVVTFVGSDGDTRLALDDVAAQAGTIGYEILTGLSPRLPRVWAAQP